jgi:phosphoribosylformylglycinamidine cyclo-ligase
MDYKEAGVDVEAGRAFVERIRKNVESTFRPEVIGGLGGFGGCFQLPAGYREPVLVSGTDGVGTKLKTAHALNRHDTVGIDLVAMCVNDILTSGAEPLFFLDYLATGKLEPYQLAQVVEGIATACRESGCTLLGGETAEMPGFYGAGEYDLAGFCVGIVEKSQLLDGSRVQVGDMAIALASAGVHSNGFSLVRKIVEANGFGWDDRPAILEGASLGEALLIPTRLYVQPVIEVLRSGLEIHGMAHITGGGIPENLPRCLGPSRSIRVDLDSWQIPPIFQWLAIAGEVDREAMFNTFNMGIGYVVIVPGGLEREAIDRFSSLGMDAYCIGEVIEGTGEVLGLY